MRYHINRSRRAGMMSMVLVLVILFLLISVATVTIMATASQIQSYSAHQSEDLFAVDSVLNMIKAEAPNFIRAAASDHKDVITYWDAAFAGVLPTNLQRYITDEYVESRQDICYTNEGTAYMGVVYICTVSFEGESITETYHLVFAGQDFEGFRMGEFLGYA